MKTQQILLIAALASLAGACGPTSAEDNSVLQQRTSAAAHGVDIDEQGYGTVAEPRMYQLIRQPSPIADREFEIEFLGSDVQVFDFTFG